MADFSKPATTDTYSNVLTLIKATVSDLALGLDPATTTPTNLPTNSIRWTSAAAKWQKWNGTSWVDLASAYAISISGNAATATALATARNINGVSFNGSSDITVTANTTNALTFSNAGGGAASGLTFNGSAARTISYDTFGAPKADGTGASGTWSINISGNAGTVTGGVYISGDQSIGGTKTFTSSVNATGGFFVGGSASPPYVYEDSAGVMGFRTGSSGAYKFFTFNAAGNLVLNNGGIVFPDATSLTSAALALVNAKTSQASTSGTAIDFTAIPAGVKRVTICLSGVSTSGSSPLQVQIGPSGGFETTGYASQANTFNNTPNGAALTSGFALTSLNVASYAWSGIVTLVNLGGNTWVTSGSLMTNTAASTTIFGGNKTLAGTLDRVRITTVSGGDTFDAGSINVIYE